ncbi:membrane protein [Terrabacter sp. 28]|nr:membrane protein [Terrabacter sp. 28]
MIPSVDVPPNHNGLPGIAAIEKIVGALLTFGLIAAVAGIAISAIAWAIGSHSSNPHVAGRGKTGVLVSAGAAMLIGAANTLVTFFSAAGSAVQ